jgi:hypothetical protein
VLDGVRTVQPQLGSGPETQRRNDGVAQMMEMGYDFEVAIAALEHNSWDVNRAVESLS